MCLFGPKQKAYTQAQLSAVYCSESLLRHSYNTHAHIHALDAQLQMPLNRT
jgi:hypothetical protein